MTRDEVLRMAREAAERGNWKPGLGNADVADFMERFAALVADHAAAAEREACAKECFRLATDFAYESNHGDVDEVGRTKLEGADTGAMSCARAIRARSTKP